MTFRYRPPTRIVFACIAAAFLCFILLIDLGCKTADNYPRVYTSAGTIAGTDSQFGEPFGITVKGSDVYVSDGESGKIWRIAGDGNPGVFVAGLDTPSGIAFDSAGGLIVADSGTNTIDRIDASGQVTVIAGIKGKSGFADGEAMSAQFNRPIGVAVGSDGKIFVADTYNDRIRVIENGRV